jgi:hypothetical protein
VRSICCSPFPLGGLTNRTVSWFPSPAASNGACGFPALRSPVCFARRFMKRSQLAVLSIPISHQHLLRPVQPLPSSSSCISSVSGLADCRAFLSDAPASHHRQRNDKTAGFLRSLGVTPVHRYCKPFRHRLAVSRFPGVAGYTAYPAPPISRWDEDGFSSCSTCPCHRATPTTPPESPDVSVSPRHAMLPSPRRRGLGLRI